MKQAGNVHLSCGGKERHTKLHTYVRSRQTKKWYCVSVENRLTVTSHHLRARSNMRAVKSINRKLVTTARAIVVTSGVLSLVPSLNVVTLTVETGPLPALLTAQIVMW